MDGRKTSEDQDVKWLKEHLISISCALNLHRDERIVPVTRDVLVKGKLICEARLQDLGFGDDVRKLCSATEKASGIVRG